METLTLGLILLVLLASAAGFWFLRAQLRRHESRLEELESLSILPDRLKKLSREFREMDASRLQAEIQRLKSSLTRVEALVAVPAVTRAQTAEPTRPELVRAAVTRFLKDGDYRSVQVLDLDEDLDADPVDVRVEAVRAGLLVKGVVKVEDLEITETRLDPSYSMFP